MKPFADSHIHFYEYNYENSIRCLDVMHSIGITDTAVHSLSAYPSAGVGQNLFALYVKSTYNGPLNLRVFGSLHEFDEYRSIPYEIQLDRLLALGCDGMKFIHMKPNARSVIGKGINDESYDKLLSIMEERGTPMVMHSGDPVNFWDITKVSQSAIDNGWFYGDTSRFMPYGAYYQEVYEMLDKHPNINLTMAHFFFLADNYDEAERVLEKYPNLKFDLTPAWEIYVEFTKNPDKWHDFFEKYSDRILFGTDSSDRNQRPRITALNSLVYSALSRTDAFEMPTNNEYIIHGIGVSDSTLQKICYGNYIRYFGNSISSVNSDLLYSYAEKMLFDIEKDENQGASRRWLESILKK